MAFFAQADLPLSQTTDPNYRLAWSILQKPEFLDMHAEALDTGQDPATRIRAGRPPHPSRPEEVRNLNSAIEDFRRSRFTTLIRGRDGQQLTRVDRGLREVYLQSQSLPESGGANQATKSGTYQAAQKILGHLRTTLAADAILTERIESYEKYFKENQRSLQSRYPELQKIKNDGGEKVQKPSIPERAASAKSAVGEGFRRTFTMDNAKSLAHRSVNISGVVAGMGAYFIAEHLALCWKNDDADCFRIFRDFTQSGKGFFFLTSYVAMMEASRRVVGWSLGGKHKMFGEGTMGAFWMSFGISTLASNVFQAWFTAEYVPLLERCKKEYAFLVSEIDRVKVDINALEQRQAGKGGSKDTQSPETLKNYLARLEFRKAELKSALDERIALFWNDIDKRIYNWDKIAYDFVKTGLILSWIQQAKVGGELSMEAFRFKTDVKKGLIDFANAEKENLVSLLKDQSQKTMEVERAGFRHLWHQLEKTRAFGVFRNGLVLANAVGVNAARAYGTVPAAARTAAGVALTYLMPKRFMGPLQGIFTVFYDKFLKYFLDAASFAFVNSAMNKTVDYMGYKYHQTSLFPKLYYHLNGLESSLKTFVLSPQGEQLDLERTVLAYNDWFGHFREVAKTWQGHREVVIHKPIETGLDSWAAWISGHSIERYKEREWIGFFQRTAHLDRLDAYQQDQKFLANGADRGRVEWHVDPAKWSGELSEEHKKYARIYEREIRGKNINVEKYLLDKEKEAFLEIQKRQQEKISEIGTKIDEVFLNGSARNVGNGISVMVDLLRTAKAYAVNNQVPSCEIPQAPGNLNSSYIEEIKYYRLLVLSWVQTYPDALDSREMRDLYGGLRPSPCDFGPYRSRLRMSLENVADVDIISTSSIVLMASRIAQRSIRWSVVARVVGKHLLDILGMHEVNRLKRDRLADVTWNYVKKVGRLEEVEWNLGKALVANEANRRVLIDSFRGNGFVFDESNRKHHPFEDEETKKLFAAGMQTLFKEMTAATIEALRKASKEEIIGTSVDETNLKICMDSGSSEADCRKALGSVGK